jgi:hypothetical protein
VGFDVLPGYTYPETTQSCAIFVSLPTVREGPAAGECEPQGRHRGGPHRPQEGTAIVLQHMRILTEQIICLKDEKTLLIEFCRTN